MEEEHQSFQNFKGSDQDLDSHRQSRDNGVLSRPADHTSKNPHSQIVKDPAFRSSFGVRQRLGTWFSNCFRCQNNEDSYVNNLDQIEKRPNSSAALSEQLKKLVSQKIMKIKIGETSRLQLDANVMHPFVNRVHIVNKNTGCYVQNLQKTEDSAIYHKEQLTSYNLIDRVFQSTENDILLPFATACCDFRKLGNSKGVWNQKFFINYPANLLLSPDTLFLFEILDFNHQALLYRNNQGQNDRSNMFRVAWAYLRPVGIAKNHLGKVQLQLYQYKYNPQNPEGNFNKSYIPDVYYDFLWNSHEKYEGFLQIQLNYCQRPRLRFINEDVPYPTTLFQQEQEDKKYLERYASEDMEIKQEDRAKATKDIFKFFRNRQICEIPQQLIYKFQSQNLGCFRLKFINNYLVAACSRRKNTYLKVFSLEDGEHVMDLKGHRGVIYDIVATPNQRYIVTAGSDHIVRIMLFPEHSGEFIDEDQSEELVIADCVHSAAVYSISLIHQPIQDTLFVLTCCFDGYIRLWECRLSQKICRISKQILINDYSRSTKKVYPTASAICQNTFFLVGDSIGQLRIYDYSKEKLSLRCIIASDQMKDDMILNIHVLNKSHLIIQASDNLVRHFDLIGNKIRLSQTYSGGVFEKQLVQCALSPDNKYLMSPSEAGRPLLWDVFTGSQVSLEHLNLNLRGHLVCCDWHPRYNLVAISGFVEYCPVFIYGNILGEAEMKMVSAQIE